METNATPDQITGQDPAQGAPSQRRRIISRRFGLRLAGVLAAVLASLTVATAQPASAASSITPASGLTCERYDNYLSISPPRVWASYRTEQVTWSVMIQRWNGRRRTWVNTTSAPYYFYSSFNYFGQSATSWTSGWYQNNTLNIRVYKSGYYRAYSAVWGNQGGVSQQGLVDGGGYCHVY